jgi:hypothetical protein
MAHTSEPSAFLPQTTVHATQEQLSSKLEDEVVILNLANSVYYGLDSVGARIWELIQEPRTIAELQAMLLAEYEVEPASCEKALLDLLRDLQANHLITLEDAAA